MAKITGDAKPPVEEAPSKAETALKKKRSQRSFPASTFEEPLEFAKAVFRIGVQADNIELTPEGRKAVDEQVTPREQSRLRVQLAISQVEPFQKLYEKFMGNKLPAHAVLIDAAKEIGIDAEHAAEAVDTFVVNLRFVGLLKTLSGAERIISLDMLLGELPASISTAQVQSAPALQSSAIVTSEHAQFESTCFYIAPIGDEGSEPRKHSDLFLGSLIEPALEPFKMNVIRADSIDKPGVITRQIIEYIMRSRLVIADLS